MAVTFDDVQLNVNYAAVAGGPEASTSIVTSPFSGVSQRNVNRLDKLHRYSINYGLLTQSELNDLRAFHHCRDGMARAFRFKDWTEFWAASDGDQDDYVGTPMQFGTGDGVEDTFGLYKWYTSGGITRTRRIVKPVSATVVIYVNDVLQTLTTDYTISYTTGIVTFTSPPTDTHTLKWTGQFDVPVFFGMDWFAPGMNDAVSAISYDSMPLIEVPSAQFELAV